MTEEKRVRGMANALNGRNALDVTYWIFVRG